MSGRTDPPQRRWDALFEAAATYEVTLEEIVAALGDRRQGDG